MESQVVRTSVDPVTYEVVSHRIAQIAEEMGIIYMRCSGSHVLITGNDAASGITMADGSLVAMGPFITTQGNVLPLVIQSTQRLRTENPGIHEGDIFVCNDPYLGAIHQPDIATVAPVFFEGKIVAWVGASGHQVDNGGMDPGGFSTRVVDIHQEGLRMPPVKIVERGLLREDIFHWIMNAVRDPLVGLDVKAQIGALTMGTRRMVELFSRYGTETVIACMQQGIDYAERKLKERLRQLPDGTWREVQYIDHDGHAPNIYKVVCTLTKRGDRLSFDFTGTDPAPASLINCTYSGLQAGILTATYVQLGYDLPWNKGIRNCMDIYAPDGCIVNAQYPTPCSMATISAVIITIDCVFACLSKLMSASGQYFDEAMSTWTGSSMGPIVAGTSQHGFRFATTEMSHFAGGCGARTYADGVDTGGIIFNTTPNISNIEDIETDFPILYLFRKHLQDSGGPGRWRGGFSGELAYIPHDNPKDDLESVFATTGAEMPNAGGLWGGLPGACVQVVRVVNTDIPELKAQGRPLPASLQECSGQIQYLPPKHARTPFRPDEVWYHNWQGAGGYGDPLDREPERVVRDVVRGLVSQGVAEEIYGVIVDAKGRTYDAERTTARRAELRAARLATARRPEPVTKPGPAPTFGRTRRIGEYLELDTTSGHYRCRCCNHVLGHVADDLYSLLAVEEAPLSSAGPVRGQDYDRGRFHLRKLYCPECATQIDTQVQMNDGPVREFRLAWPMASEQ